MDSGRYPFCRACGRRMSEGRGTNGMFWECPRYRSLWSYIRGEDHDAEYIGPFTSPRRFDRQTGKRL